MRAGLFFLFAHVMRKSWSVGAVYSILKSDGLYQLTLYVYYIYKSNGPDSPRSSRVEVEIKFTCTQLMFTCCTFVVTNGPIKSQP